MSDDKTIIRGQAPLFTLKNLKSGERFDITGNMSLGRHDSCDITIPDKHISRHHATLQLHGNKLILVDNGSENGSFVNGLRVRQSPLRDKDLVAFDCHEFMVLANETQTDLAATMVQTAIENGEKTAILPASSNTQVDHAAATHSGFMDSSLGNDSAKNASEIESTLIMPVADTKIGDTLPPTHKTPEPQRAKTPVQKQARQDEESSLFDEDPDILDFKHTVNLDQSAYTQHNTINLYGYHPLVHDEIFPLNREVILVGKSEHADITLKDKSVSSEHAELYWDNGYWVIQDLGSTNGTFINGYPLEQPTVLMPGDLIQFGLIQLVYGQLEPHSPQAVESGNTLWVVLAIILATLAALGLLFWLLT